MIKNTRTKLAVLGAATLGFAGLVDNADAMTLVDENFQTPFVADGTGNIGFTGISYVGNSAFVKARSTSADVPGDTDYANNQVLQLEYTNANPVWVLTHNWAADDVFTLTFNAAPQAWNIQQQRFIRPMIKQNSDDTVLWDAGETSESELFWHNEAVDGPNPYAWNGPGPYGNSDWQSEADTQFSFTINAADFVSGTEGESIYLQIASSGDQRGVYIDNVQLSVGEVPEPGSLALLGLGGLLMTKRRRRDHQRQRC